MIGSLCLWESFFFFSFVLFLGVRLSDAVATVYSSSSSRQTFLFSCFLCFLCFLSLSFFLSFLLSFFLSFISSFLPFFRSFVSFFLSFSPGGAAELWAFLFLSFSRAATRATRTSRLRRRRVGRLGLSPFSRAPSPKTSRVKAFFV